MYRCTVTPDLHLSQALGHVTQSMYLHFSVNTYRHATVLDTCITYLQLKVDIYCFVYFSIAIFPSLAQYPFGSHVYSAEIYNYI